MGQGLLYHIVTKRAERLDGIRKRGIKMLSKEEFRDILFAYYKEHYGVDYDDVWYDTTGVNVASFGRGDRLITLKCHVLNGSVTEYVEKMQSNENQAIGGI